MAEQTGRALRNALIYSVYVRNYGKQGTFREVAEDVERIRRLGTDIVWLMPIHPIGEKNKKGSLGCPYSIQDYRRVNPEYGTLEDFQYLVRRIHECGMKCMIDVVYNHTSWDSVLLGEHPEYFYKKADGSFGNRAGVWEDVVDLDYGSRELWDYQIASLKYWVSLGVDGFRCDVASMVPVEFWKRARAEVAQVNPEVIWLAESVHRSFIAELRESGFYCASDSEVYQAFDITYDYDIRGYVEEYFEGKRSLRAYLESINEQETTYPANYVKLRCLENHDLPRATHYLPERKRLEMWTAWIYLLKGTTLLYNGQECLNRHTPSLFEKDEVSWEADGAFLELLNTMASLKKEPVVADGAYRMSIAGPKGNVSVITYASAECRMLGIFNLELENGEIPVELADGWYENAVNGKKCEVRGGKMALTDQAVVILEK